MLRARRTRAVEALLLIVIAVLVLVLAFVGRGVSLYLRYPALNDDEFSGFLARLSSNREILSTTKLVPLPWLRHGCIRASPPAAPRQAGGAATQGMRDDPNEYD